MPLTYTFNAINFPLFTAFDMLCFPLKVFVIQNILKPLLLLINESLNTSKADDVLYVG